jgi:hypothetical protein
MISGWPLAEVLIALSVWLVLLGAVLQSIRKRSVAGQQQRRHLTVAGLTCCAIAVGALFCLHLSWASPTVSQKLGTAGVGILGLLILWPTLVGLFLSAAGLGKGRVVGVLTCLATGLWYFTLSISSAISMGSVTARHPKRFLIPVGYVGWITIKYGEVGEPPLEMESGAYICRFPKSGTLATSSKLEEGWAKDEYFYYSNSDHLDRLRETGWGAGGRVWGGEVSSSAGTAVSDRVSERIYIGTEDQFRRDETRPAY